jgi:hypothetical protein
MYENEISIMLKELPDTLKKEVLIYVNSLLIQEQRLPVKAKQQFQFLWEKGLAGQRIGLSSIDLQHKSTEWR